MLLLPALAHAQAPAPLTNLYRQVAQVESSLFAAFNRCDSVAYTPFFAPDLGGLAVGRKLEMLGFQETCARGIRILHFWQHTAAGWRITRIISYGHDDMKND